MDRENKAVKIRSGSPQKTQLNLILSFLAPPYRLAWPRSCWINYSSPITDITPLPLFTATCRAGLRPAP